MYVLIDFHNHVVLLSFPFWVIIIKLAL